MLTMQNDRLADTAEWIKLPWATGRRVTRGIQTRIELDPECMAWLEENVGQRDVHYGIYQSAKASDPHMAVCFPDAVAQRHLILLFKLTWGGK